MPPCALTVRASGRVLRLISTVKVFPAFAPGAGQPEEGKEYQALYDTGATHSCVSPKVVDELKLASFGATSVGVGGGNLGTTTHLVNIGMPNHVMFPMMRVAKVAAVGVDVIIGMDVIGAGDFAVTHQNGKTTFSFCCPSRKEIDFVNEVNQDIQASIPRVGRNDPCPCNSGKKYKKCHGS
jgi:hypothetical protein